jgi:hypothetical protein
MVVSVDDFRASLSASTPAPGLDAPLTGLWWAAKGRWDDAHRIVQEQAGADAAWVHAYLHRVEGDLGNAAFWYRQAGQPVARDALDDEWQRIVAAMLGKA